MNEFLAAFSASLKHMRADEKEDILQDFREHFEIGRESGKSEEEIASELGDPRQLARMYSAESATNRAVESKGLKNTLRMLGAIIRYKIGGGLLIILLYFVCLSVTLMLFGFAAGLMTGGAGCVAMMALELTKGIYIYALLAFFASLLLSCGGALWWKGTVRLWKATILKLPYAARRIMRSRRSAGPEGGM
jgi:uncharacterized membrane protein